MGIFETTATTQADTWLSGSAALTAQGASGNITITIPSTNSATAIDNHGLFGVRTPEKPLGADRLLSTKFVLTYRQRHANTGSFAAFAVTLTDGTAVWTEASATWSVWDIPSNFGAADTRWTNDGGASKDSNQNITITPIGFAYLPVAPAYAASFAWDITSQFGTTDWEKNLSFFIIADGTISGGPIGKVFFDSTVATVAYRPHLSMRFADDPPSKVNVKVIPDTSLSESTFLRQQRAVLIWDASTSTDFYRYRIRSKVSNISSSATAMSTKTLITTRGSTSYLDTTQYTDGSTVSYTIYVEDARNTSAGTNAIRSDVVTWTKPDATLIFPTTAPSFLQEVEADVRSPSLADASIFQTKIYWGDGGVSFSRNRTSAGGYLFARHRYSKATTVFPRAQIENLSGFRSAPDGLGTSVIIVEPGPVAILVASPARQRTASTFNIGTADTDTNLSSGRLAWNADASESALADGVGLSFKTVLQVPSGTFVAMLLRDEGAYLRIVYADEFTSATVTTPIRRSINWAIKRGDMMGIRTKGTASWDNGPGPGRTITMSLSSTAFRTPGIRIPKYRFATIGGGATVPTTQVSTAYTNPVFFSAKDSFARGANRIINRFRWAPDYTGDFGAAWGSTGSYTTGATSAFYWAWTTATTQFVAVRAVDNTSSSGADTAGVVISTEATFRIPDELRDGIKTMTDNRGREFALSPGVGFDYGQLDVGSIKPVEIRVTGEAFSLATTTNDWIDVARISAAFQQRKRIFIIPPWSTATAAQGYLMDPPVTRDSGDPVTKKWSARIAVVQV